MDNPFSWDNLTTAPEADAVFGPWSTLYLLICIVGLIIGFLLYSRPRILSSRRLLRTGNTQRWGGILLWIFSIGIFFFLVRWLQINPFSFGEPIWLYLTLLIALVAVSLLVIQIRFESTQLSEEAAQARAARAKGIQSRRPPRRSRNKKR